MDGGRGVVGAAGWLPLPDAPRGKRAGVPCAAISAADGGLLGSGRHRARGAAPGWAGRAVIRN